jgi:hypothetical protein
LEGKVVGDASGTKPCRLVAGLQHGGPEVGIGRGRPRLAKPVDDRAIKSNVKRTVRVKASHDEGNEASYCHARDDDLPV